jgi:hypothetical protein
MLKKNKVTLGMSKRWLQKKLGTNNRRNRWNISTGQGRAHALLKFKENLLISLTSTITQKEGSARHFPLQSRETQLGMHEKDIRKLWGRPDIRKESHSEKQYSLILTYYWNPPKTGLQWKSSTPNPLTKDFSKPLNTKDQDSNKRLKNQFILSGDAWELHFNASKQLIAIHQIVGKPINVFQSLL